ncbi:hypothetical protein ABG768_015831 [Culter alburnus]|uniref:Uncharacterized protein n=1 Tax=Culter alburnus TaxID=194366 RepID=A0AAW1YX48_CULAL
MYTLKFFEVGFSSYGGRVCSPPPLTTKCALLHLSPPSELSSASPPPDFHHRGGICFMPTLELLTRPYHAARVLEGVFRRPDSHGAPPKGTPERPCGQGRVHGHLSTKSEQEPPLPGTQMA